MQLENYNILEIRNSICTKHNVSYDSRLVSFNNKQNWSKCPRCSREDLQSQLQQDILQQDFEKKQLKVDSLFARSAIPPRFKNVSFNNYVVDSKEKIATIDILMNFVDNLDNNLKIGRSIILSGNPGTGKTHLSIAIAKAAMTKCYTSLFTTIGDMIDKINEAGWNKATAINNYVLPDLLILDEMTYSLNSEEQKTLFKVINKRYENLKSIIILTNLKNNELKDILGERIIDRIIENNGVYLQFTWESFRKNGISNK